MRVKLRDPGVLERSEHGSAEGVGNADQARSARPIKIIMDQPLILTTSLQERLPGLGFGNG